MPPPLFEIIGKWIYPTRRKTVSPWTIGTPVSGVKLGARRGGTAEIGKALAAGGA
jgi:hypothetical protein